MKIPELKKVKDKGIMAILVSTFAEPKNEKDSPLVSLSTATLKNDLKRKLSNLSKISYDSNAKSPG